MLQVRHSPAPPEHGHVADTRRSAKRAARGDETMAPEKKLLPNV
jgi:hypothetical protein